MNAAAQRGHAVGVECVRDRLQGLSLGTHGGDSLRRSGWSATDGRPAEAPLARAVASPRRVRSANLRPSSCPAAAAVPADLVGLSCGVEAAEDFVEDLRRALAP